MYDVSQEVQTDTDSYTFSEFPCGCSGWVSLLCFNSKENRWLTLTFRRNLGVNPQSTQCAKHRRLSPVFTFIVYWHMIFLHSYTSAKESNIDNHSAAWHCGVFFLSTKGAGVLCFVRVGSIGCWWGLMSGATGVSGRETDCPQIWNTTVCHQSAYKQFVYS